MTVFTDEVLDHEFPEGFKPVNIEAYEAKKNQIIDCPDAEALAVFKHSVRDEWLARHLARKSQGQWQP